ncbi:hypothetical protein L6164_019174 [Bauhinia variegata]|uniref:Uncharacterized protein n=1 Tax=Bauhinia variegata TaxID=167791 RepID=A0ACB9NFJ4_BAUVA|nr:hypothetical protein L6164_019174 [Bauhinia variegata]
MFMDSVNFYILLLAYISGDFWMALRPLSLHLVFSVKGGLLVSEMFLKLYFPFLVLILYLKVHENILTLKFRINRFTYLLPCRYNYLALDLFFWHLIDYF